MTDIQRITAVLSDGRWHDVSEFADHICIDYRSRITEMRRRGANLEARPRVHVSPDGRKRTRNDWRDLDAYRGVVRSIADQAASLRRSFEAKPPSGRETVRLMAGGTSIDVRVGRLMLLSPDTLAEEVASLWCDPYR